MLEEKVMLRLRRYVSSPDHSPLANVIMCWPITVIVIIVNMYVNLYMSEYICDKMCVHVKSISG